MAQECEVPEDRLLQDYFLCDNSKGTFNFHWLHNWKIWYGLASAQRLHIRCVHDITYF